MLCGNFRMIQYFNLVGPKTINHTTHLVVYGPQSVPVMQKIKTFTQMGGGG